MSEIAVIGAGAWGMALAVQAARAGREVVLWARDPGRAGEIGTSRMNPRLPGVVLPASIRVTAALPEAAITLLAVPLQHMRGIVAGLPGTGPVVVCAKGVEQGSLLLPLEVLATERRDREGAVLTGPNFAHEVAAGLPAAAVVAGREAVRAAVMAAIGTPGFRLYGNDDAIGAQVGGAAKNVVAIAAGVVVGARGDSWSCSSESCSEDSVVCSLGVGSGTLCGGDDDDSPTASSSTTTRAAVA